MAGAASVPVSAAPGTRCGLPSPLLYAHRGAAAELPENTMPSFRRALELGAGALEMDLHMTSDGHIMVSHDRDGRRLAGIAREIRSSTRAEVERWDVGHNYVSARGERFSGRNHRIPTLEEVLVELPAVPVNIDVKQRSPSMVAPLLALLERLGAAHRVLIASFDSGTLAEVRRRGYPGATALGQRDVMRLLLTPELILRISARRGDAAQLPTRVGPLSLAKKQLIAKCHALGLRVDYWTVNRPDEARALLALGADGIMTDDPAAIGPVFRERKPAKPARAAD